MTELIRRFMRRGHEQPQSGVVIIWGALLMVIFMTMAAFVIDLGAWYARRLQLQRAVDAASTAGTQRIEDLRVNPAAVTSAITSTLAANGFSAADFTIETCPNSSGSWTGSLCTGVTPGQETAVRITDNNAPQFFSQLVLGDAPSITRLAKSRLEQLPKTGSPYNSFGDGRSTTLAPGTRPSLLWAQVGGRCNAAEDGDLFSAAFDQNNRTRDIDGDNVLGEAGEQSGFEFWPGGPRTFYHCDWGRAWGAKDNPAHVSAYDPKGGYIYRIEVPASSTPHYIYGLDATFWTGYQPSAGRTITAHGKTYTAPPFNQWSINCFDPNGNSYAFCLTPRTLAANGAVLNFTPNATDEAAPDTELCPGFDRSCRSGEMRTDFYLKAEKDTYQGICALIPSRDVNFTLDKGWKRIADPTPGYGYQTDYNFGLGGCAIPASSSPQVWYLRVNTTGNNVPLGLNGFGLKVVPSGQSPDYTCSTATPPCPTIQPDGYFSVLAKLKRSVTAPTVAEIPLVKVQSSHNGTTLRFTVFDPGEGADTIEILNSAGNPVSMKITKKKIMNDGTIVDNGTLFASTSSFDVSNSGCSLGICPIPDDSWWEAGRDANTLASRDKYNDRMVQIEVPIQGVVDQIGKDKFYSIRYTVAAGTGRDPNDSTTWKVEVVDNRVSIIQ